MRGLTKSTTNHLPDHDLHELADELAIRLSEALEHRVFALARADIATLIAPYVNDLEPDDQDTLSWLIWDLFQEAACILAGTK